MEDREIKIGDVYQWMDSEFPITFEILEFIGRYCCLVRCTGYKRKDRIWQKETIKKDAKLLPFGNTKLGKYLLTLGDK